MATETPKIGGTTPEILAPYSAHKPEMALVEAPNDLLGKGYYLRAITDFEAPNQVAIGHRATDSFEWYPFDMVLPVLKPFSAILQDRVTGVSYLEGAALLALPHAAFLGNGCHIALVDAPWMNERCAFLTLELSGTSFSAHDGKWYASLGDDFELRMRTPGGHYQQGHHLSVLDYLRSQHFALPVNGRPLIEGVDFIAKTSAALPIDKEEAS